MTDIAEDVARVLAGHYGPAFEECPRDKEELQKLLWSDPDLYMTTPTQEDHIHAARAVLKAVGPHKPFQARVQPWLTQCFGPMVAGDKEERNHRFLEEALELVQACDCTVDEAHQLVDYVFGRSVGDKPQEVGGVMVTLAALCLAHGLQVKLNWLESGLRLSKSGRSKRKSQSIPCRLSNLSRIGSKGETHGNVFEVLRLLQ